MFWRKREKSVSADLKQRRADIVRNTVTLVKVANEAEAQSSREGKLEDTTARELARARAVRDAQRLLVEDIVRGFNSGLTFEELSNELIDPVVEQAIIGDVARYALGKVIRDAGKFEREAGR